MLDAIGGDFTQRLIDASPDGSLLMFYSNLSTEPARIKPNSISNHGRRVEGFYLGTLGQEKWFVQSPAGGVTSTKITPHRCADHNSQTHPPLRCAGGA